MARNLGVRFDSDFSFLRHVQNICKSCFAQIRDLMCLRGYLTRTILLLWLQMLWLEVDLTTIILVLSLAALDLCKLQCIQNSLARIITNTTKYSHITPVRKTRHWWPIEHRSIFKAVLQVYKVLHSGYPKCLMMLYILSYKII